jgi:hypothetical protein
MATSFATIEDVEFLWRPLAQEEVGAASVLLARVSALVRTRIPDIDTRIAGDPNFGVLATGVVVDAVLRVLRNPEGYTSEQIGAYAYSRAAGASGLYLTDLEWALLLPPAAVRGAFTIRPWSRSP